jgi:menaquinol-cytochrome c reductase cytochrome b/c subunit
MSVDAQKQDNEAIFPRDPNKTYALAEWMRGTSPMVDKGPDNTVFSFPVVALLEAVLLLGTTLLVFVFSLLRNAPLEDIANPNITTNPAKAPWYFVGLQELLEHMHPMVAGVIIPTVLVIFLLVIPYLDNDRTGAGRWFTSARGKRITFWSAIYALIVMPLLIVGDNVFNLRESLRSVTPEFVSQMLLPLLIVTLAAWLPSLVLWRWKPTPREIMLCLFTVMIVAAVVFTVSGFLFRGPGFKLYLPWQMPNGYDPLSGL